MRIHFVIVAFSAVDLAVGMIARLTLSLDPKAYFGHPPPSLNESLHDLAAARPPPPPPPPRPPPAGPASDALWAKCRNLGCSLTAAMRLSNEEAGKLFKESLPSAQSPWRNYPGDLQTWFWNPFPQERWDPQFFDFYNKWGVGHVFADLGISDHARDEGGTIDIAAVDHESYQPSAPSLDEQVYYVGNKMYRATGASFAFGLNPEDGAIIAMNRRSPKSAAQKRKPPVPDDQLPDLSRFSDIAWLAWSYIAKADVKKVRYFFSLSITNQETQEVIKRALDSVNEKLSQWPGHTFDIASDEGRAILGTPNAMGFGYFLVQHKEQLGNLAINKIQVFAGDTIHKNPCILAYVDQDTVAAEAEARAQVSTQGTATEAKNYVRIHTIRYKL